MREAINDGPVTLDGTFKGVATLAGVGPGAYAVTARVVLAAGAVANTVICQLLGGDGNDTVQSLSLGTGAGAVSVLPLTLTMVTRLSATGSVGVSCNSTGAPGAQAFRTHLALVQASSATTEVVTG